MFLSTLDTAIVTLALSYMQKYFATTFIAIHALQLAWIAGFFLVLLGCLSFLLYRINNAKTL